MPNVETQQRGRHPWLARAAGVAPGALLTAAMLLAVVASARSRGGWLLPGPRAPIPGERVVFVAPRSSDATAPTAAPPRATTDGPAEGSGAVAPPAPIVGPTSEPPTGATPTGTLPAVPRLPIASRAGVDSRLARPRGYVPPGVDARALRLGTPRPDHAPLDSARRDSALAAMRADLSEHALRGRIPVGSDDAGKALAPVGATGLSADGRRDLARAAIVDWQRRDAAAQVQEKGRRPALTISRRLSFGGPRPPAVSDAEVRAMFERTQARVRRRADSLAWLAESTRVAREREESRGQSPG
ncbi:hypothetical protein [Roseisolibacter agri]|uniref:Uncharacterized protein n=1 Tax=Roseisolibacter agri TaxID=2014610 RepID=A0AA37V327_9BACT|nr:hypothetical protein [Roseisolibacter agri]GLC26022.1 hypothetical protein rosag_25350 [Roseisolibacter agri]